ncbi:hypothetical protein VSU19_12965 [Verrucomicrobiales bacterium BCK34]|nr:hypothetical protein [Verrucomicrobiales bacterium BCK34]
MKTKEDWFTIFADHDEAQLEAELSQYRKGTIEHQVVTELLARKRGEADSTRHTETINQSKQQNGIAKLALIVAILALIQPYVRDYLDSRKQNSGESPQEQLQELNNLSEESQHPESVADPSEGSQGNPHP